MNNFKLYTAVTWFWFLLISVLTVLRFAPDHLHADILMNSVMSLQKLTPYYWGQNRLLNVLPLAVSWIRNPVFNLAGVLAVTSMCFYGLLYIISRFASFMAQSENEKGTALAVFIITSSAFLFVFNSALIPVVTIGHIEYSLPALLLAFSFFKLLCGKNGTNGWREFIASVVAIFFAIGINPSTVIPAVFISIALVIYRNRINLIGVLPIIASAFSFFVWSLFSKMYGDTLSYNEFSIDILYSGFSKVIDGLLHSVNLLELLVLLVMILAGRVLKFGLKDERKYRFHESVAISYAIKVAVLFFIGWLLLFSGNRWVEMNLFDIRYFVYIIFSLIFIFSLNVVMILSCFSFKKQKIIVGLLAVIAISSMASTVTASAISFKNFAVFKRVDALTEPGRHLYSGDYWVVWPSVMRDMMHGHEAYGLTFRGEANGKAAREYILGVIRDHGSAEVYCLMDTVESCINSTKSVAGPLHVLDSSFIRDGVHVIRFSEHAPLLDFKGNDFMNLPSQVGDVEGSGKTTRSHAGWLVYGPYAPLKSGQYLLSFYGSIRQSGGAYIDVVSEYGETVHGKFILKEGDGSDHLIKNATIDLPENVANLEVRVWVEAEDDITLFGYSLMPVVHQLE